MATNGDEDENQSRKLVEKVRNQEVDKIFCVKTIKKSEKGKKKEKTTLEFSIV
jgi:hypothetical protein